MDVNALGTKQNSIWIIIIASIFVLFAGIKKLDVYALDEAKNAECAREMLETGNFIVPTFNYELRTDKPPLHYYFMILGYKIFGVNGLGARFFSSLFGVLTILLVYFLGSRFVSKSIAWVASLLLLSSLHFTLQMHMSVPDPYLIFFLTLAFLSFYGNYTDQKWRWFYWFLFYASIGLGLLTKGPIALGLPGIVAVLFLLFKKDFTWKTIWRLQPFGGVLLSLAIAFPWYYAVHLATNGAFTEGFFFDHNLNRFGVSREGHGGSFILPLAFVLLGFLAVVNYVFLGIKYSFSSQNWFVKYALIVAAVIIIFFSFSGTKLPNYTVPSYPFLAFILASLFVEGNTRPIHYYLLCFIMTILPFGLYFGIQADDSIANAAWISWFFLLIPITYIIYPFFKKLGNSFPYHVLWAWVITGFLFFEFLFPVIDANNPVNKLKHKIETNEEVVAYKKFNPAFSFMLKKKIPVFMDMETLDEYLESHPTTWVLTRTEFRDELNGEFTLYDDSSARDIFELPTTLLTKIKQN